MLYTALLLGVAGSFHCLGMCAPIFWALGPKAWWSPLAYHAGRIAAYALMGTAIGLLGQAFLFTGWQQGLAYFSGGIFIVLGLLSVNLDTLLFKVKALKSIYEGIAARLAWVMRQGMGTAAVGFLNGFLPCGLVYMALFGALAMGNWADGAIYMGLFGAGTLPLMLGAAYGAHLLKPAWRQQARRAYPVLFVLVGVLMLYRGYHLPAYQGKDAQEGVMCAP
jgi:hypothetical protein